MTDVLRPIEDYMFTSSRRRNPETRTTKPKEVLEVVTDTTWHDMVADVINKRTPGTVTVFDAEEEGHKKYEYPQSSPFRALTRAAQNFDVALQNITPDNSVRSREVRRAIKKVYKDQTPRRWGRRRR